MNAPYIEVGEANPETAFLTNAQHMDIATLNRLLPRHTDPQYRAELLSDQDWQRTIDLLHGAPDLLAACSAVAEDSRLVCNLETGENYYPITPEEMGAIRRAIAKAKGTA